MVETQPLSARLFSPSPTTRFWLHSSPWPGPSARSNAFLRSQKLDELTMETCRPIERHISWLSVHRASAAFSAFTWRGIGDHSRSRIRIVTGWLLQRCLSGARAESDDRQVATSVERRSLCDQRYTQVLPRLNCCGSCTANFIGSMYLSELTTTSASLCSAAQTVKQ